MLLISSLLMGTTSYAWFVLSTAPEVTGISTNVGANGSLEIALLNAETRTNPSAIKAAFGESLQDRSTKANENWGNMVDLSFTEYGLGEILLMPARLSVTPSGEGYKLDSRGMLAVPTYAYDGRVVDLDYSTFSGTYNQEEKGFTFQGNTQDYGVRAIGTSDTMTAQQAALMQAKAQIAAQTANANSNAANILSSNGEDLFTVLLTHFTDPLKTFGDTELGVIKNMISGLQKSVNSIEMAVRQGIIAYGASKLDDKDTFNTFVEKVNGASSLNALMSELGEYGVSIPSDLNTWIEKLASIQNKLNSADADCAALNDGSYTWEEISDALMPLINTNSLYINGTPFPEFDKSSAMDMLGGEIDIRLAPGSGVFADIADFVDDYEGSFSAMGTIITMSTSNTISPAAYLVQLGIAVGELEAAGGNAGDTVTALDTTYGYAIDFAFRSNAAVSDLLLQTDPEQRVYDGSNAPSTLGGGSFMEFSTDSELDADQILRLMDAVRVAFVDDADNVLRVAKLNVSNRTSANGKIKAPLYLYDYEIDAEDKNAMIMGERQVADNVIVPLEKNVAKTITAIVWLDGDVVDNTMVSAETSSSIGGTLNLQFASSANLLPAENGELMNIAADSGQLAAGVALVKDKYEAGQGMYTTESWKAFAEAYTYAETVSKDPNASQTQIYFASENLLNAGTKLEITTLDALTAKINAVRGMMGTDNSKTGAYIVEDKETKVYTALTSYTEEQIAGNKGEIKAVDNTKNRIKGETDRDNITLYSEASWSILARALYNAEAVAAMGENAQYEAVDAALDALVAAEEALEREIYFTAYDLNGTIYYKGHTLTGEDTYGKWFDNEFNLVTADIVILDLDADAELADIAVVEGDKHIMADGTFNPYLELQDEIYPELNNDHILGVYWETPELFTVGSAPVDKANLYSLIKEAEALNIDSDELTAAKEAFVKDVDFSDVYNALSTVVYNRKAELDEAMADMITSDDILLLTKAIDAAMAIDGYSDATKTELDALRNAVSQADYQLTSGNSHEAAQTALDDLNAEIAAKGGKKVTAYNTIVHEIPVGHGRTELAYVMNYPTVSYVPKGELGEDTLSIWILTEKGVIYEVKQTVSVYEKAEGAEITPNVELAVGKGMNLELTAALVGGTEKIESVTWSTDDDTIAKVDKDNGLTCEIKGVAAGVTYVNALIKTIQGNEYVAYVNVTVTG